MVSTYSHTIRRLPTVASLLTGILFAPASQPGSPPPSRVGCAAVQLYSCWCGHWLEGGDR